jgi:hypothetical protein
MFLINLNVLITIIDNTRLLNGTVFVSCCSVGYCRVLSLLVLVGFLSDMNVGNYNIFLFVEIP